MRHGKFATTSLTIAAVAAIVTLFVWRRNPPPGTAQVSNPYDLVHYYYPMTEYAGERLASGQIPLWNPYPSCGTPFLATLQVGVFYPATWLSMIIPAAKALPIVIFVQILLGGIFAALYFRALHIGAYASTIGGALFAAICMLGQTFWPAQVATIMWMPLLFLSVEKLFSKGGVQWWVVFTLATALQMLAGFPQFFLYTFYLLIPYALLRWIQIFLKNPAERKRCSRLAATLLAGPVLAAGIAAVQLLPTRELAQNSGRSGTLTPEQVHYLDKFPKATPRPGTVLANVVNPRPKYISFDVRQGVGYLGTATVFLAFVGLLTRWRNPLTLFFLVAAVLSLLLSFGFKGPTPWLYELYASLPTGLMFRTPGRFRLITFFCVIALAVFGFDRFQRGFEDLPTARWLKIAGIVTILCLAIPFLLSGSSLAAALAIMTITLLAAAALLESNRSLRITIHALMLVLVVADITHAIGRYGVLRAMPLTSVHCVHHSLFCSAAPEEKHRGLIMTASQFRELTAKAGLERIALLDYAMPRKPAGPLPRAYMITDYEPLVPGRWARLFGKMGLPPKRFSVLGTDGVEPIQYSAFFDMASVRYFIGPHWSQGRRSRKKWGVAENPDPLPRTYVVDRFELCSEDEALDRILAGSFDHRTTVLLETKPRTSLAGRGSCGWAAIVDYQPERVVIKADCPRAGILVLSDTHYPGWRATVDGNEQTILHANFLFRAVEVPAGQHEVIFEYKPASFRTGAIISAASLALLALIACVLAINPFRPVPTPGITTSLLADLSPDQ